MKQKIFPWERYILITIGLGFLALVVLLPLINIFYEAFSQGVSAYWQGINTPEAHHALMLSLIITVIAVPVNTIFGLLAAWVLARQNFVGKQLLLGIIDLPLTISPVIIGLMFVLLFSPIDSIFKSIVVAFDLKILFALPSMILVTMVITVPFVVREVLPALENLDKDQEESAMILGASPWQVFWQVILPNINWAVLYGVILCTARALGEFGAVAVVSGRIISKTNTLTLHIEQTYSNYETIAAFSAASLLALITLLTIICEQILDHRQKISK
ncbi:sulfate transport system permease protein CysW [Geminocystis sp. NIES-3708]|uniref:sulfate ABC transporter permease subunit CysW n=1 Tax=Geminocystis sp. NIES-3708 TaxID=1615909 RepID=UPI0005FC7490|nr:sulfate ABC transporter permease subunit CysW [Geminocystis sp. NIES-3708]BAQ60947.1 sulfate transport system permease protein CysW [Geminocystis sp. NIES-3708]